MKKYRSLEFLQAVGLYDADQLTGLYAHGDYKRAKAIIKSVNEYQLKLYHSKILKMPLSTFESNEVRQMLYYGIIQDLADWDRDRAEAWHLARLQERQEAQDRQDRKRRLEGVGMACAVYFILMCALAVGVCLYAWARWR